MKHNTFLHLKEAPQESITLTRAGKYVVFFHNLSGDLVFDIQGENIDLDILGLYTGREKDTFKLRTTQRHNAPRSKSNLLVKGVFDSASSFSYQGLIRIEKGAKKTHAYQKNQNIILSPSVFVSSQPDLEILADDVFCTHGSSTGKLNKDELFFLQSRSLSEEAAKKLLVTGFLHDIFMLLASYSGGLSLHRLQSSILKQYD